MTINKTKTNDTLEYFIEGKLDTTTAPELEGELNSLPQDIATLIFNFEKLSYISSAGLRVLLKFYKRMTAQGTTKITHANESILDVLEMTGFTDFITAE